MSKVRHDLPTIERLNELFEYKGGYLYWKSLPSSLARKCKVGEKAGSVASMGYWRIGVDGNLYFAHRLIYAIHNNGFCPDTLDHIDGIKTNNQIENLRPATASQNAHNVKLHSRNKSGFRNVSWLEIKKRWRVLITVNGKRKCWLVKDIELADLVAQEARAKYHGGYTSHGHYYQGT